MKQEDPDRYARLEQLTGRTYSDVRDLYGGNSSKEKRRAALANALAAEVGASVCGWVGGWVDACVVFMARQEGGGRCVCRERRFEVMLEAAVGVRGARREAMLVCSVAVAVCCSRW